MEDLISIRDSLFRIAEEIKQDRNDMYQKLLKISEEIDSLFSENEDYSWPMSIRDFCNNFDINKNTANTHKRKYLTDGDDYFTDDTGPDRALHFTKCGALKIFSHCRSEKGARYKRKHGSIISPKEEHLYLNTIKYAMRGFEIPEKEFLVKTVTKNYKIDLYLRNSKLAIECDERDHYEQEYFDKRIKREEDIYKVLGCRFLRFDPYEVDFNVGEVINVIFHHIFGKLINGKDAIDYYNEKSPKRIREVKYNIDFTKYE
jgi:very-short-patch-repair endonuclease